VFNKRSLGQYLNTFLRALGNRLFITSNKRYVPFIIACCISIQVGLSVGVKFVYLQPWFAAPWVKYVIFFIYLSFLSLYAVLWQNVLKLSPLSQANSTMSLTVLFIFISGVIFFREPVTEGNILGMLLIISGLFLISRTESS